jgi:hypothetical protein
VKALYKENLSSRRLGKMSRYPSSSSLSKIILGHTIGIRHSYTYKEKSGREGVCGC